MSTYEKFYVQKNHMKTKRDHIGRMNNNKVECMKIARQFSYDFWDGDRKFGYGGHKYIDGYWEDVAKSFIKDYNLNNESKILDVGCGKGFLLYEITKILPNIEIYGFDISEYAIKNSKEEISNKLFVHNAANKTKFQNNQFDLVFSLATLHNLNFTPLLNSIKEISRISKKSYIMIESYRTEEELFNLQCWALTCNAFYSKQDWLDIFSLCKYEGDYEFIYF